MWKNLLLLALVLAGLSALLAATIRMMGRIGDTDMSPHGMTAMVLGIVLTVVVGCGITGLLIWSARRQDAAAEEERRLGRL